jgi:signal transduction histidine kinase
MARTEPDQAQGLPSSERSLRLYVAAVIVASLVALVVFSPPASELTKLQFWLWLLVCLGAEFLWLETKSGEATDSMASTVNLAVIYLFGHGLSLWIIGISVFLATRFIQRRNLLKSVFGFSQMILTTIAAGLAFRAVGGSAWELSALRNPVGLLPCVAAGIAYSVVNPGLVSVAVSMEKGLPLLQTWRENYGYRNFLLSSLALFVLSPLLLIAYLAVGWWGVLLFFLPMLIVKNQNQEYIQLQRAQDQLIASERMVAMAEVSGSIAHELRNYLQILKSRGQLLIAKAMRSGDSSMAKDAQIMQNQLDKMTIQVEGLLGSSRRDVEPQPTDLNGLTREVVEFNKAHNLFDKIDIEVDLDPAVGYWSVDPTQISQLLTNFLRNAGDAISESNIPKGVLKVTSRIESTGAYHLSVEDNGPGVPMSLRTKIFEPHFTTKKAGNGYGLSTCYMIMKNHGGKVWVDESTLGGARFHISLPESRKAGTKKRASPSVDPSGQARSPNGEPPEDQRRAG